MDRQGSGPGRWYREGLSIIELFRMFPNDAAAEQWFEDLRWPDGERSCPDCGADSYSVTANRKPMPYRCRGCREYFSVRKGSVMQSSKLGLQKWVIAIYMMTTGLKGTSSMKLHRELGIRQATAWHLMQRIREAFSEGAAEAKMTGPVEVDETYLGGKERNKHADQKLQQGRGTVGKSVVAGVKDRTTKQISAAVVSGTTKRELQTFVHDRVAQEADVFTDDLKSYEGLRNHAAVRHSVGEYVRNQAHVNGMESFWSMLKRGYYGTYHRMSPKHLHRYVREFAGRHNIRDLDTVEQMTTLAHALVGKRLRYRDLIGGAEL